MKKDVFKKLMILGICFCVFLTTCSPVLSAQDNNNEKQICYEQPINEIPSTNTHGITHTYLFSSPTTKKILIENTEYVQVELSNGLYGENPGEPVLPTYGAILLLPYGQTCEKIQVIPGEISSIQLDSKVKPAGIQVPLSQTSQAPPLEQNSQIYSSSFPFPGKLFGELSIQKFRGFEICFIPLYPIQYSPTEDVIDWYSSFTVVVQTADEKNSNELFQGTQEDYREISSIIDNPETIQTYFNAKTNPDNIRQYDLLILTTETLKHAFIPLAQTHNQHGIRTRIKTLNDITSQMHFPTDTPIPRVSPEDIRNFIQSEYTNYNIRYVLIGGDDNIVPVQQLYFGQIMLWGGWWDIWGPSDMYYSCLNGPYNSDGDDKWGENHDGENGADVDLMADVSIGRAPVGNSTEAGYFVNKTIAYMNWDNSDDYMKEALFAGEYLWGQGEGYPEDIYGDFYMEELIGSSDQNGYSTIGFPNDSYSLFNMIRFYDHSSGWSTYLLQTRINQGVNIINHLGHGDVSYALKMQPQDVLDLTNIKPCFIYSQACLAGGFDFDCDYGADCMAEFFTVKTDHAAVAVIMNTRYGLGDGYGTDGYSQRFQRWFWDGVFDKGITTISEANQYSKTVNIPLIHTNQDMRFCCYEIMLFGDPVLKFNLPKPEHDVSVKNISIPYPIKSRQSEIVQTTLVNNGLNDEQNVQVSFRVNNVEIMSRTIPMFVKGTEKTIDFPWMTPSADFYMVTINISVPGVIEHDYRNNEMNQIAAVGVLNRNTNRLFNSIQEAIDDPMTENGSIILIPRGTFYEHLDILKDISLVGANQDKTILDGSRTQENVIKSENVHSLYLTALTIQNGVNGIILIGSSKIQLRNLGIVNNTEAGISLVSSQECIIYSCKISGNQIGIRLQNSSAHSYINSNTIIGNSLGIFINQGNTNNLICLNNFNNRQNAYDAGTENLWNINYPTGGNYWDDYNGGDRYNGINQDLPGPDGIGDTPYYLSGGNTKDRYPLMHPFTINASRHIINLNTGKQFMKIGDAIEDIETVDGHTIMVESGTYYEKIIITKSIQLIGENKNTTIIDGDDSTQEPNVVKILKNNTRISGFTIQNSNPEGYTQYVLLKIQSHHCLIDDNKIIGKRNSGINIWGVSLSQASNNTFLCNTLTNNERGFVVIGSDNSFIDNNIIQNNWGMAMYSGSVRNLVYNNNFNNTHNVAAFNQYTNIWDDGSEGNYWHDYRINQGYQSGVYIITNPNNIDHHPYEYPNGWE